MYHTTKMVTGVDEVLSSEPSTEETGLDTVLEGAKYLVGKGLDLLTKRERDIVQRHYGLGNNGEEMTLDQIGKQFGVTKERVRQIERRALSKIRSALQAEHAELIRD
jgi:RNA polymerase sigma factor (sigma-70 family)